MEETSLLRLPSLQIDAISFYMCLIMRDLSGTNVGGSGDG